MDKFNSEGLFSPQAPLNWVRLHAAIPEKRRGYCFGEIPMWSKNGSEFVDPKFEWPCQEPIDWRYLPYIRPIVQAYVRQYPHKT